MSYTLSQYAHALYECIKGAEKTNIKMYVSNLYNILVKNNQVNLFKHIGDKVAHIEACEKNIVIINIVSASKCDAHTIEKIQKICGYEKTRINQYIDPSLIGGIKIQIGDMVIDGSIKKQLQSLKQQIT